MADSVRGESVDKSEPQSDEPSELKADARRRGTSILQDARAAQSRTEEAANLTFPSAGLVAELPSNLARGLSGRRDFGPRMGGTLSTHSTHSTLTTRASTVLYAYFSLSLYTICRIRN